jgi:hypothetical protein
MAVSYNEFQNKLENIKREYLMVNKKELRTMEELQQFLLGKMFKNKTRGLKSLRGLNF